MAISVFISYDFDNDRHYKYLLQAWNANRIFDFSFFDQSVDVSVNSTEAAPIRRAISRRINQSNILLCLVGEKTHRSGWVTWEINKAYELGVKIVAVKIKSTYTTPSALFGKGAEWAYSFTFDSIKNAINKAYYGFAF